MTVRPGTSVMETEVTVTDGGVTVVSAVATDGVIVLWVWSAMLATQVKRNIFLLRQDVWCWKLGYAACIKGFYKPCYSYGTRWRRGGKNSSRRSICNRYRISLG